MPWQRSPSPHFTKSDVFFLIDDVLTAEPIWIKDRTYEQILYTLQLKLQLVLDRHAPMTVKFQVECNPSNNPFEEFIAGEIYVKVEAFSYVGRNTQILTRKLSETMSERNGL